MRDEADGAPPLPPLRGSVEGLKVRPCSSGCPPEQGLVRRSCSVLHTHSSSVVPDRCDAENLIRDPEADLGAAKVSGSVLSSRSKDGASESDPAITGLFLRDSKDQGAKLPPSASDEAAVDQRPPEASGIVGNAPWRRKEISRICEIIQCYWES